VTSFVAYSGGKIIPGFSEWVLPTYASMIGFEIIYKNNEPVVTWKGFYQCLQHQFLAMPNEKFLEMTRLISNLGIVMPQQLARSDFPAIPNPMEKMKADQVYDQMFQGYFRWKWANAYKAGHGSFGGSSLPVHYGVSSNAQISSAVATSMGKLAFHGGMNLMNAASGLGGMGASCVLM
jgi:hypothetical protein